MFTGQMAKKMEPMVKQTWVLSLSYPEASCYLLLPLKAGKSLDHLYYINYFLLIVFLLGTPTALDYAHG